MSVKIKQFLIEHGPIILLVLLNIAYRILLYYPYPVIWDEGSYLLAGKYILSSGQSGIIEAFRPLVLPILLGTAWKLNLDPIFWGKGFEYVLSIGSVVLIYLIGLKVYNKTTGLIAALLFSFSQAWYTYGNYILTEIPSVFFGLLAVYFYLSNRYFSTGGWAGLALMTKFTQMFTITAIMCAEASNIIHKRYPQIILNILKMSVGIVIFISIYLLINNVLYNDPFTPFAVAKYIYSQDMGGNLFDGILLCIKFIIKHENWILIFAPVGIFFTLKNKPFNHNKMIIMLTGLFHLAWIVKMPTEVDRFLIPCLPYLYLMTADGIMNIAGILKNNKRLQIYLIVFPISFNIVKHLDKLDKGYYPHTDLYVFQKYFRDNEVSMKGTIWISDPIAAAYTDLKISELIHYPVFNRHRIADLRSRLNEADYILMDTYYLKCLPADDIACLKESQELYDLIKQNFDHEYYFEHPTGAYFVAIFKRRSG